MVQMSMRAGVMLHIAALPEAMEVRFVCSGGHRRSLACVLAPSRVRCPGLRVSRRARCLGLVVVASCVLSLWGRCLRGVWPACRVGPASVAGVRRFSAWPVGSGPAGFCAFVSRFLRGVSWRRQARPLCSPALLRSRRCRPFCFRRFSRCWSWPLLRPVPGSRPDPHRRCCVIPGHPLSSRLVPPGRQRPCAPVSRQHTPFRDLDQSA